VTRITSIEAEAKKANANRNSWTRSRSKKEFMDEEEEEPEKDTVSEEDILSRVGPFQVPQHHEIIPLSILGCGQQDLEIFLSDFKWAGSRLARLFADG